jgi:hypothetical protein
MPSSAEVLARLAFAANRFVGVAIAWHALIYLVSLALLTRRFAPSARVAAVALTTLLASVATIAFLSGNPFNGVVFAAAALGLLALALRVRGAIARPSSVATVAGIGAIVVGVTYPHFLAAQTVFDFFYASPTGLVPCPTLLIAIGFTLLGSGFGSRAFAIVLAALGIFYGMLGTMWLGVTLDLALLGAALALLLQVSVHSSPGFETSTKRRAHSTSA